MLECALWVFTRCHNFIVLGSRESESALQVVTYSSPSYVFAAPFAQVATRATPLNFHPLTFDDPLFYWSALLGQFSSMCTNKVVRTLRSNTVNRCFGLFWADSYVSRHDVNTLIAPYCTAYSRLR